MDTMTSKEKTCYIGVLLISCSLLMLEILSTRIAKINFGYNFQFIIISLAMLGIGMGGIIVFYVAYLRDHISRSLVLLSWLYSVAIPFTFIIPLFKSILFIEYIKALFFCLLTISYLAAGMIIPLIFSEYKRGIAVLCFLTMLGSAVGSFLVIAALDYFGNERAILFTVLIATVGLCIFSLLESMAKRVISVLQSGLIVGLIVFYPQFLEVRGVPEPLDFVSKTLQFDKPIRGDSNSLSLLETYEYDNETMKSKYVIFIDSVGKSYIPKFEDTWRREEIKDNLSFIPYTVKTFKNPLIIGSGGGYEVAMAIAGDSTKVTVVEINPLMKKITEELLQDKYNVYEREDVELHIAEGRNFLVQSKLKYDRSLSGLLGAFRGKWNVLFER